MAAETQDTPRLRRSRSDHNLVPQGGFENKIDANSFKRLHLAKESLFSSKSGFKDYSGILNWGLVLLIMGGSRLALENILKYGILISPYQCFLLFFQNPFSWPLSSIALYLNIHIAIALLTEKYIVREVIGEKLGHFVLFVNLIVVLILPAVVVLWLPSQPQTTVAAMGLTTIVFLKLISYKQTNSVERNEYLKKLVGNAMRGRTKSSTEFGMLSQDSEKVLTYPFNLRWRNMYYFMFAPTLCYELNYPMKSTFDMTFLLRRVAESIMLSSVMLAVLQQWIIPVLNNSKELFVKMNYYRLVERLLKLAVPNHIIWLMFFYVFFHSGLNVVAEVTHFGDREFYKDWWNSRNVAEFWQKWNIPVHRFGKKHVYKVLLARGWTKIQSTLAVFFFSAFFHEYLISIPLKIFRVWLFLGMLAQVPLAVISLKLSPRLGNVVMWVSLIIGQPAVVLMYFHDYYLS